MTALSSRARAPCAVAISIAAAPVSRVSLAPTSEEPEGHQNAARPCIVLSKEAAAEIAERRLPEPLWDLLDEQHDAERLAIEQEFGRKTAALRRLGPRDRAAALRAAREQRQIALALLREKRRRERHGEYERRQQRKLTLG